MTTELKDQHYPAVQFRIARPTNRLADVIRFYTKGLQLPVLFSFEGHEGYSGVMIGLPGLHHHLEFTQDAKGLESSVPTKENLLVFYFQYSEDLNSIRHSLEALGCQPVAPENPYWQDKSWTYVDPDGWRVVLCNGTFLM